MLCLILFTLFELLWNVKSEKQNSSIEMDTMMYKFTKIYKYHKWVRGSGRGSDKECTNEYRLLIKQIFTKYNIKTIIDFGCGDWKMLSSYNFENNQSYTGYDIVKSVIDANKKKFARNNIEFIQIDNSLTKLKKGDIILIKDVFQHWNNENIINFIRNILPFYKYALITNKYNYSNNNKNIEIGSCRSLDLERAPFNMNFIYKRDLYFCTELKRIYLYKM